MIKSYYTLFLALLFSQVATGQRYVLNNNEFRLIGKHVAILPDPNSDLKIQSVIHSDAFCPSDSKVPNLGITSGAFWVKIKLKNSINTTGFSLQIAQPTIDSVDFFEFRHDSLITENHTGNRYLYNTRLVNYQAFTYPLCIANGDSVTCYFRFKSGKQLLLPIYLGGTEKVTENDLSRDLLFGIYVGIILVMIFYNLFIYLSSRDRSYLYYVLYLVVVLFTQPTLEGYTFRLLLPEDPYLANMGIFLMSVAIGISAIEFSKNFLASRSTTPVLHKVSYVFWAIYGVATVLALAGSYNISYKLILSAAMFSSIYVMWMAIVAFVKGSRSARYFLIAWTVFIICVVVYVLKDFGVIAYNNATNSSLLFGSAFEAVMLSFALADKINIYRREKEVSQAQAFAAVQENERIVREQNVILEKKVEERTEELQITNVELNKAMKELKDAETQLVESEKMASLGQLTAGVAHEINNPINFVTSNVKPLNRDMRMLVEVIGELEKIALENKTAEEKQKMIAAYKTDIDYDYLIEEIDQLLSGIGEGASRTAEIVKGLRIFSRLDEDDLKKADINEGLDSTLVIINNQLSNVIKIEKNFGNLPLIDCYPGKLNQVFLNIISNAIHAVKKKFKDTDGGLLSIATYYDEEFAYIAIKDNGTGMDENTRKRMFEPFFTTKDVGEGTGLGMSIAYNTINKHNGEILVKSELGIGTEFILKLPLVQK